ncbi:uncharacterized protein LOC141885070 [Acropora palmata]|uniref:uncharacterized protein LOC141885070 n=1 Tax=Acropora palmata TaxID=6131 RepID=UPI003DA110F3
MYAQSNLLPEEDADAVENVDLYLATNSDQLLSIFSEEDINHKLATFNDTFLSTLDTHAPIKTIRIRSCPCPYITPEIKDQMTSRAQLFPCYRQSRNADDWRAYKEARRSVKQLLKNAACDYICREVQLHKDNPGSLWKIIHTCIPSKEKESPVYSRDTELVANNFKQLFVSVGRNAAQTAAQLAIVNDINTSDTSLFSPPTISASAEEQFNFTPVTCLQVECIVLSMPSNKSPGPDKVSMRTFKDCLPVIVGPLTDIINCSFATSTFPNSWKTSEAIPLLKDGDHKEPTNNRPLSILAVASKICEKVALQCFNNYLQRNGLLR